MRLPCEYGFTVRLIPRNDGIRPAIIFGMAASTKNRTYMHERGHKQPVIENYRGNAEKCPVY